MRVGRVKESECSFKLSVMIAAKESRRVTVFVACMPVHTAHRDLVDHITATR